MNCPKCGGVLPENSGFCQYCGIELAKYHKKNNTPFEAADKESSHEIERLLSEKERYATLLDNANKRIRRGKTKIGILIALLIIAIFFAVFFAINLSTMHDEGYNEGYSSALKQAEEESYWSERICPLPENGKIIYKSNLFGFSNDPLGLLTIETTGSDHHYIKLRHHSTGTLVLSFFVRAGQTVEIDVPLGEYDLSYASGETWYGANLSFGPDTTYSKADDSFKFEWDGEYTTWWTIELFEQINGNLPYSIINPEDF